MGTKYLLSTDSVFPCSVLHADGGKFYRVFASRKAPLSGWDKDNILHVHVGEGMIRLFPISELPDVLRLQLAMIHAWDWEEHLHARALHLDLQRLSPLTFPVIFPKEMEDIGWMVSETDYVLVLPETVLIELRGEFPHG